MIIRINILRRCIYILLLNKNRNAVYKIKEELSDNLKPLNDYIINSINVIEYNFYFNKNYNVDQHFKKFRAIEEINRVLS